jgi:hypothetical protein
MQTIIEIPNFELDHTIDVTQNPTVKRKKSMMLKIIFLSFGVRVMSHLQAAYVLVCGSPIF